MELLEQEKTTSGVEQSPGLLGPPAFVEADELAARRTLRAQIARLERELSDAFVTAFPMGGLDQAPANGGRGLGGRALGGRALGGRVPHILSLGELERVRDELTERLRAARITISRKAELQEAHRLHLEQMLLEPAKHRFARVACRDLGEGGCGVWQVRPRLGLIGMLMGWWQVKLSSGCPLA